MLSSGIFVYFYHRQQLVDSIYVYKDEDAKRPYVEKYGERAKTAVMVITTEPDTLCDAYVQQHLELKQIRHRMEGYVIDEETEKPLPDTWISYRDGAGAATDSTGHFILWLPRKDITLQASRVGYHTVRLNQLADTTLTIRMKDATKLKEVKATPKPAIRIY
ncbi:MAG: carboxypeptidase-like regulatory domain-containing protein [Prevotella sp.]|nr:carboxypeptidase-like regulatory domain-containing protein [Prevotella sp.]